MATDIGIDCGVLADGIDLSQVLNSVQVADPQEALDSTRLRNVSRTRQFSGGLLGGAVQTTAFPDISESLVNRKLRNGLGVGRSGQEILVCGANVGEFALLFKAVQTNWRVDPIAAGLITSAADFQVGGGGARSWGVLLQTAFGGSNAIVSELVRVAAASATVDAVVSLPTSPLGVGGNINVPRGMTTAALQTAIRALAGYNDSGVVVSGAGVTAGGGANEIQTLTTGAGYTGGAVTLPAENGGTAQTVNPGDTLAAIQTKKALAANKTNGDIVATGASVAAGAGYPATVVVSSATTTALNGCYTPNGNTINAAPIYQIAATAAYLSWNGTQWVFTTAAPTGSNNTTSTCNAYLAGVSTAPQTGAYTTGGGGTGTAPTAALGANYASIVISGTGAAAYNGTYTPNGAVYNSAAVYQLGSTAAYIYYNATWYVGSAVGTAVYASGASSATIIPTSGWGNMGGFGGALPAPSPTLNAPAGAGGSFALTFTYSGASVSNQAQSLTASPTAGVTIARTQSGAPQTYSGSYDITLGGALNGVNISPVSLISGANWTVSTIRDGGVSTGYNLVSATGAGAMVTDILFNQTSNNGADIAVHTVLAGTSASYTIQHSVDNGSGQATTWVDLVVLPAVTAIGVVRASVSVGTVIQSHLRINVTSITGSFVSAVAFARR